MSESKRQIVVAGDASVDWLTYPVQAAEEGENWRLHEAFGFDAQPGGAALLSRFIERALKAAGVKADVHGPALPGEIRNLSPDEVVHANAILGWFRPRKGRKGDVLRVERSLGYIGPREGRPAAHKPVPDPADADIVVLDDAGNGIRFEEAGWPAALTSGGQPIVVHKLCRPLANNPLAEALCAGPLVNHVLVINADDLRASAGVQISRSLSWERTAKDFAHQIELSEVLSGLQQCPFLIVLFGTDGAILRVGGEWPRTTLIFDPRSTEGAFASQIDGAVHGLTTAFTASLVASLAQTGVSGLISAIGRGLHAARSLLSRGYLITKDGVVPNLDEVFDAGTEPPYQSCRVTPSADLEDPDPDFWRILDQRTRYTRLRLAEEIVVEKEAQGLRRVPIGAFGKLETIDRAEIESYNAIRELITEFLANPSPPRPLCFAVFGPPGAGKSFGVKQVLKSIGDKSLQPRTFNVSQFADYQDLVAALHEVRDIVLEGKVPFVFFDEFDSARGELPLGWLKYFLAPMQDAEFKDGEAVHPIGKAVFVFAGGTRSTFESFTDNLTAEQVAERARGKLGPEIQDEAIDAFRGAKGPDFVSRLRGFINIMGPNRQATSDDDDEAFIIRRAKVMRVLMMLNPKAGGLLAPQSKTLRIDDGVLRALLHISDYRHGTRSLEAVIDMSRLAGKQRYDLSALPPKRQLDLHVDADEFLMLANRECFQSMLTKADRKGDGPVLEEEQALLQAIAVCMHESYRQQRRAMGKKGDAKDVPFEDLIERKKRSNIDFAADIPRKLRAIDHGVRRIPEGRTARTPDITDEEVDQLARLEHKRFCRERRKQGVRYGEKESEKAGTHPYLVRFDKLPEKMQEFDRQLVISIPRILAESGYEVFRMEEHEDIEERMIDRLARAVHADYVEKRAADGDTPEKNDSMVPFDKLDDEKKESNRDNARSTPRKLRHFGYGVRPRRAGETTELLQLTRDEIEALSIMEHARWNWYHRLRGWVHRPGKKDKDAKPPTHPDLVTWADLPDGTQEYDRQTVRLIPTLLERAGYVAFRLE